MNIIHSSEECDSGLIPDRGTNNKRYMASYYKEGSKIQFDGYKGEVIKITETYRKNVLVIKVTSFPRNKGINISSSLGLFEYPDGRLEFMAFID